MGVDLEKGKLSSRATLALCTACVGVTVWLAIFISGERDKQTRSDKELRGEFATAQANLSAELSKISNATQVQAAQTASLREYLTLQLDFMARDVTRLREDMARQEATTSDSIRELRADLRDAPRKDQPNGGGK